MTTSDVPQLGQVSSKGLRSLRTASSSAVDGKWISIKGAASENKKKNKHKKHLIKSSPSTFSDRPLALKDKAKKAASHASSNEKPRSKSETKRRGRKLAQKDYGMIKDLQKRLKVLEKTSADSNKDDSKQLPTGE